MEEKILKSFKRFEGKEVKDLDLMVSLPDDFDETNECEVMERKSDGKVWAVICTKMGNVKETILL